MAIPRYGNYLFGKLMFAATASRTYTDFDRYLRFLFELGFDNNFSDNRRSLVVGVEAVNLGWCRDAFQHLN